MNNTSFLISRDRTMFIITNDDEYKSCNDQVNFYSCPKSVYFLIKNYLECHKIEKDAHYWENDSSNKLRTILYNIFTSINRSYINIALSALGH